jgi:hypothetical protein
MGVEHMGDLHALLPGNCQVILHVSLGVHDSHGLGLWAADNIGEAPHAIYGNLIEIHTDSFTRISGFKTMAASIT